MRIKVTLEKTDDEIIARHYFSSTIDYDLSFSYPLDTDILELIRLSKEETTAPEEMDFYLE